VLIRFGLSVKEKPGFCRTLRVREEPSAQQKSLLAALGTGLRGLCESAYGNACQSMRHPRVCTAVGRSGADQCVGLCESAANLTAETQIL